MRCGLLLWALLAAGQTDTARYELRGRLAPGAAASVWLHGATAPFEDSTLAEDDGRFRFRGLAPGTYTLEVVLPGHGEMRRTVEVGPGEADRHKRVELVIEVRDAALESKDAVRRNAVVSVRTLAIPDKAYREFEEARRKLARRDPEGAIAHLERAVALAPQYTAAWNHLGTIAYQTGAFERAEHYFRQALAADSNAFEPLVNLGGVLINLNKLDEALEDNRHAVPTRSSARPTITGTNWISASRTWPPPSASIRATSRIPNCCWRRSTCGAVKRPRQRANWKSSCGCIRMRQPRHASGKRWRSCDKHPRNSHAHLGPA
jgi:tetratricopeptide (TPR) repeat protein